MHPTHYCLWVSLAASGTHAEHSSLTILSVDIRFYLTCVSHRLYQVGRIVLRYGDPVPNVDHLLISGAYSVVIAPMHTSWHQCLNKRRPLAWLLIGVIAPGVGALFLRTATAV